MCNNVQLSGNIIQKHYAVDCHWHLVHGQEECDQRLK